MRIKQQYIARFPFCIGTPTLHSQYKLCSTFKGENEISESNIEV